MMHKFRFAVKKYQFLLTGAIFSKYDHMILTGCVVTHHQMSLPTGSWQTITRVTKVTKIISVSGLNFEKHILY